MEGKVINIKGFKAVGLTYFGNSQNGKIKSLWDTFNKRFEDIKAKSKSRLFYGICEDAPDSQGRFHYTASAEVDDFVDIPEGMQTKVVPDGKYLVYTYTGTLDDIDKFYSNVFSKFIPGSKYEMDYRPQLELYDDRYMKNGEFDVYIPIK